MLFLTLYTSYLTSLENIFPERRFFFSLFQDNFILNIYHNWPEIIVKMKCTCFFGSWNDSTVSYSCLSSVETMNASIIPNKRFKTTNEASLSVSAGLSLPAVRSEVFMLFGQLKPLNNDLHVEEL